MPIRSTWYYREAQKNVLERLQKEWEPPAVPCATPTTTFLKKRIHAPLTDVHHSNPKNLRIDRIPQQTLCASYNLQLNDLHVLMPRNMYKYGVQKRNTADMWHNTLCSYYPIRNIRERRDYFETPKVHDVLLKFGGPEVSVEEPSLFTNKTYSQKTNPIYEVNVKKFQNSQKTFYIQMPQIKLRVGNLDPKRCHMQRKKKEPFIL